MSKIMSGPFNCPLIGCHDPEPHKHSHQYLVSLVDALHISIGVLTKERDDALARLAALGQEKP